jgi:hypothetical protein
MATKTSKQKNSTKKMIETALATGGEHLGDIVMWSLPEATIKADALKAAWVGGGLDEKHLPVTPTPYRALVDATVRALQGAEGYEYERAGSDAAESILAVMKVEVLAPGKVKSTQEARVAVDDKTGQFLTDDARHEVVRSIRAKYDTLYGCFLPRDITKAILKVVEACAGVAIRESGGVYWIPRTAAATVRTLETVVDSIGEATFDVIPVHQSTGAANAIGRAAKGSIEAELTTLKEELAKFATDSKVRSSTIQARIDTFQALRARASLYHSILAVEVDDLGVAMEELEEKAAKMLAAVEEKEGVAA